MPANTDCHTPIHPGEILSEEFMEPYGLSANKLSKMISVPPNRITAIVNGKRGITADTAIRLSEAFGTTDEFWVNRQGHYELELTRQESRPAIRRIEALPDMTEARA